MAETKASLRQWAQRSWTAIATTYRLGFRGMIAAPALVALVVVPEFAQHVVEIRGGMFDNRAAAQAFAQSELRWSFGYVKLAGFALSFLLIARFWACDESQLRAIAIRPAILARVLAMIALLIGTGAALESFGSALPVLQSIAFVISLIVQTALLLAVVGALIEEPNVTLRSVFTERFPAAIGLFLLLALAFVPAQGLHMLNHTLALGQSQPAVWALMMFDSLVVGLMAALIGAALFVGARLTMRWRSRRRDEAAAG